METLRISPQYKADEWRRLDKTKQEDWATAADIVHDRLHGRFLKFADACLPDVSSGFVVLSIDCLLVETLQQFIEGETRDWSDSERSFKRFLAGPRFATSFIPPQTRRRFYLDIRCGLLHQAEAKKKWLVRRKQAGMLRLVGPDEYIIDVELFHAAVKGSLETTSRRSSSRNGRTCARSSGRRWTTFATSASHGARWKSTTPRQRRRRPERVANCVLRID